MAKKCSQCGRNAMYEVEGHLLCLDCTERWHRMLREQMAEQVRAINYLTEAMEMTVGMPGILPRYEVPRPPTIHTGDMTLNNFNLNDSVVGVINTGRIHQLNASVNTIRDAGERDLAEALKNLSQAVLDARELAPDQKNEAVEHLALLAAEAAKPKDQRQHSVGRTVIGALERILNAAASVTTLWPQVLPLLENLFR